LKEEGGDSGKGPGMGGEQSKEKCARRPGGGKGAGKKRRNGITKRVEVIAEAGKLKTLDRTSNENLETKAKKKQSRKRRSAATSAREG